MPQEHYRTRRNKRLKLGASEDGEPLATSVVSKDELKAIMPPDAIVTVGACVATLKCQGEGFPESHRAHLVVGFKP